ncbi:MAG TPA: dTMP kinase [bacterium]|nr:dTMP kinase [bacterium]
MTLEGPDGAGKTTQAALLVEHLRAAGHDVVPLREPGGTAIGEQIRALLIDPRHAEIAPQTEMLLFAASRAQLVAEVIVPALARGRIVVCERYVDASLAYQGIARGLGADLVRAVNDAATGGLRPDLTLLLDLDPETGLRRARAATLASRPRGPAQSGGGPAGPEGWQDGDRMERESPAFHARVREGFLALARIEPQRIRVVDARRPVEDVQREIAAAVDGLLREARQAGGAS